MYMCVLPRRRKIDHSVRTRTELNSTNYSLKPKL